MAKQPEYTAADFKRLPGDKARRYVNTKTGEIISRRQFDKQFGRLHERGFTSNEQQAKAREQAGLPKGPRRGGKGGAGGGVRGPKAPPAGPSTPPPPPPEAPSEIEQRGRWFLATFEEFERAATFVRRINRGRGNVIIFLVAYGVLRPGASGAADLQDDQSLDEYIAAHDPEHRTILSSTDRDSINWGAVYQTISAMFLTVEQYTVYWRLAKPPRGRRLRVVR